MSEPLTTPLTKAWIDREERFDFSPLKQKELLPTLKNFEFFQDCNMGGEYLRVLYKADDGKFYKFYPGEKAENFIEKLIKLGFQVTSARPFVWIVSRAAPATPSSTGAPLVPEAQAPPSNKTNLVRETDTKCGQD